jgi:flagellar basal-body rod protein FlgB
MDYGRMELFALLKARMAYNSERQDVLSQNIANADTPGYKARDLKPVDFNKLIRGRMNKLPVSTTSVEHMAGSKRQQSESFRSDRTKDFYERSLTNNQVTIEEEMGKMSENSIEYQEALNVYKKTVGMFKKSLGHSG